ncbi:VSP-like protein [Giardia lamblia P15]|uniref:VSP-like protein n=1 Tax=Giardia intestinalis (strain P15) TaxID=658858 RepID=E1F8R6_GIAIA|nr:VSP-like protein [Giardia lamblia P15]
MLLVALLFVSSTLAADCQPDGDHAATCQTGRCEAVGSSEICTQCRAGGAPIDGFCRPVGSPQVIAAGCTGPEGAPLDSTAATYGTCGGADHFLFMGGCYSQKNRMGGTICTKTVEGKCTTCKVDGRYLFQNPANPATPGNECVLCSDIRGDGTTKGVENCAECTKPNAAGVATCSKCKAGYAKKENACVQCGEGCSECSADTPAQCTACFDGKYLSTDKCVDANRCGDGNYADPKTNECKACITAECATCIYNTIIDREQCIVCNNDPIKMVKIEANGETTCVDKATCATDNTPGSHFLSTNSQKCILCSDNSDADNQGIDGCSTCKKKTPTDALVCTECLAGYIKKGSDSVTCEPCGANCATCTQIGDDQCTACKPGYFLKSGRSPSECIPCDGEGGTEGCGICSNDSNTFKCTDCKPNYHKRAGGGSAVTCEKFCEDSTACGGGLLGPAGRSSSRIPETSSTTAHCAEIPTPSPSMASVQELRAITPVLTASAPSALPGTSCTWAGATVLLIPLAISCARRPREGSAPPPMRTISTSWFRGQRAISSPSWPARTRSAQPWARRRTSGSRAVTRARRRLPSPRLD